MPQKKILAAAGVLLAAGSAFAASPASAESVLPAATSAGFTDSPTVVEIGGLAVDQRTPRTVTLRDAGQRPTFTAMAGNAAQIGARMVITELNSGVGCEALIQPTLLASCAPNVDIPYGEANIEARAVDATGDDYSDANDELVLNMALPTPTITLDSYDPASNVAKVSGTARASSVDVANGTSKRSATVDPTTAEWHADIPITDPESAISVTIGLQSILSKGNAWLPEARLAPPIVTTAIAGSTATLHVIGKSGGWTTVYDSMGKAIAGGHFVDGATDVPLRIPDHEARFSVTQTTNGGPESDSTAIVANEGIGETDLGAPVIDDVSTVGSRTVVPVAGQPGSVVTIKTLDGKTVGVRLLGTSGSAQILVPTPTTRKASPTVYTASQSIDGASSPVAVFTVGFGQ